MYGIERASRRTVTLSLRPLMDAVVSWPTAENVNKNVLKPNRIAEIVYLVNVVFVGFLNFQDLRDKIASGTKFATSI